MLLCKEDYCQHNVRAKHIITRDGERRNAVKELTVQGVSGKEGNDNFTHFIGFEEFLDSGEEELCKGWKLVF